MSESILSWILANKIELLGAIPGLIYVFLSIRQHILTWPFGLISSFFYIIVFFQAGVYAMMALQGYYVAVSIYGWHYWLKSNTEHQNGQIYVNQLGQRGIILVIMVSIILMALVYLLLTYYTDTNVPVSDSFTTSLSITGTFLLARKYIENWIIWIAVDLVTIGLCIGKGLWPTVILYFVYTIMAVLGLIKWNKQLIPARY
jgi:nicotinamide mononucleotide transporter